MRYVVLLALLAVAFFAYAQVGYNTGQRFQIAVAWNSTYHAFKIDTVTGVVRSAQSYWITRAARCLPCDALARNSQTRVRLVHEHGAARQRRVKLWDESKLPEGAKARGLYRAAMKLPSSA